MANKKTGNTAKKKSARPQKTTQKKNVTVEAQVWDKAKVESVKEIALWLALAVCVLLFLSNLGIGGVIGNAVSGFFFGLFGLLAYLLPILLLIGTFFVVSNWGNRIATVKCLAGAAFVIFLATLLELFSHGAQTVGALRAFYESRETQSGGGLLGGLLASGLVSGFGLIGAYVITLILMIVSVILITEHALFASAGRRRRARRETGRGRAEDDRQERLERIDRDKRAQQAAAEQKTETRRQRKISGVAFDTALEEPPLYVDKRQDGLNEVHMDPSKEMQVRDVNRVPLSSNTKGSVQKIAKTETARHLSEEPAQPLPAQEKRRPRKTERSAEETKKSAEEVASFIAEKKPQRPSDHRFPPVGLLKKKKAGSGSGNKTELDKTADKLEQTLRNFGINVTVTDVTCGPTVTRYELLPEVGVRVNRITNLADDIKLNLAVTDIRIEAPIPGKAAVGIEVPNKEKVMVSLEEVISSKEFESSASKVTFGVGMDIGGNVITADIAKMPHLLIAGTTGSGKSVCINTIIMSILYKATPEEVKFIMIDPKVVELSIYNGIPHLLIPVVTDPKKAAGALHWAVTEMDDRYQKFADAGVRDMKSYNRRLEEKGGAAADPQKEGAAEKMPELVVIVDELADLMMVAAKEVEESICRLAQKARAAGIYLILATQRPSVDVVTGLIKANMPSRIAFAVNSGVDSRTILDMFGAEKLLGNGDMLYYPQSLTKPLRVQGAFVSDTEVQQVVDYIRENNGSVEYSEHITQAIDNNAENGNAGAVAIGGGSGFDDSVDSYFAEAGRLLVSKEKGSIGMLQRSFKIGFNRAARIMDQLEEAGVVGPELGTKPRTVLMSAEEFERYLDPDRASDIEEEYPVDETLE